MDTAWATDLARRWERDWNSHDLDALLAHVAEDVVFTSPVAARVVPGSEGVVRGKDALRAYWARGLELLPGLHFEVVQVFAGVGTVVIAYRNQDGGLVSEVLELEDGLVVRGHGTYLV
ncbi:nuclear transport factor 2 family protein [Cellulomonas sp. NPDC055163]